MGRPFEETQPNVYWLASDSTLLASEAEWLSQCHRRVLPTLPRLPTAVAVELAGELSLDDYLRTSSPETAADELASADSDRFARLDTRFT